MTGLVGIIALPVVLLVGLLVMRVATVALTFTGLSRELARFQARSAFTGCGFTTREAERIVEHPVRRRIIMLLMLMGNGTVILAITALMPLVVGNAEDPEGFFSNLLWLFSSLLLLWGIAISKWVDRFLFRVIGWAIKTFTHLEVHDYRGLLHFSEGYTVTEVKVKEDHWAAGKNLISLRLGDEGIQVLGIQRGDGSYVGTPMGTTYIRRDDTVILYGRKDLLLDFKHRKAGEEGEEAHEACCEEQREVIEELRELERSRPRKGTPPPADGKS